MPNSRVEVDTRVMDRIVRNAPGNAADEIRKIAFELERKTKERIKAHDAIDTGAMINSVYTRTFKGAAQAGSDTSEGQIDARVKALRPDAELVSLPVPKGPHEAFVGPRVKYAVAVHYGTAGRNQRSGRPFLREAVDDITRELQNGFRNVVTDGER